MKIFRIMHLSIYSRVVGTTISLIIGLCLVSCAKDNLSHLQRRSIEAKELDGTFDLAYKATLQVMQDYGYVITHSDYQGGVIKGETGWISRMLLDPIKYEASVIIEGWGDDRVKERITILEKKGTIDQWSRIVDDPQLIQKMYDEIQREIFVRKNL